ncbi:protein RRP6-like 3 isoform X1 [Senna tora]|uniref:Protein RRP6-like 3 isoform X1 n=1 Tax=Senna tora TaxID=362788 RepID=A0A834SK44_9FABA|nr:protein RRP6-like 3 isoform X1 [Senna tora]
MAAAGLSPPPIVPLMRVAFAIASLAAISIYFAARYRSRRKQKSSSSLCYLRAEKKPQYAFKRVLADNSYTAFKHLKLNDSSDENPSNCHPFEAEITSLLENPQLQLDYSTEIQDLKKNDSYVWVETELQLKELVNVLSKENCFAVDTEQHNLRSFLGFTALVQVFHGADNDVVWLQRDFHIYVVNLFDTSKACEVLSKPQKSLAYLLETYCGVTTNKLFQREDWRQRPLSAEMVDYARTDAHYLLYIANCLITELKQLDEEDSCSNDKFHFPLEASRRSNMICLQLFSKENEASPGESAALSLFSRHVSSESFPSVSNENQFQNFVRQLCAWRDLMARIHDESLKYVLPDQAIVALANQPPTSHSEIYNVIAQADINVEVGVNSFFPSPSPVVGSHLSDIYDLLVDNLGNTGDIYSVILQNVKYSKQVSRKASRDLFVQKFSCKSPVYHNCRIYANDGRLLCYCDRRKLEWYLSRDLAKLIDEDPPAIMLLFEPKGRPEDEDNDFYIQSKQNICVGCGEGNHYLRYRIIPSCYRIHFPEHLKSHRSHDIVLLCVDCHEVAHAAAEKYKRKISAEFGIPLYVRRVIDPANVSEVTFEEGGVSPLHLRTAAMALLRHGSRMPPNRRDELTEVVKRYYGGREISDEDLERALLVGMSPHERRRFEKKRGYSFRHSTRSSAETVLENHGHCAPKTGIEDTSNVNALDGSYATKAASNEEDRELFTVNDDVGNPSLASDIANNGSVSAILNGNVGTGNTMGFNENSASAVNADDSCLSSRPPNEVGDLCPRDEESTQAKHNSKLSLLGHGPHGKLVVEHLLKEYGEDGVRQFCQRWRQAFVEAVKPRFLPVGWDVKHSGRRDFGEFSVYNPVRKAFPAPATS